MDSENSLILIVVMMIIDFYQRLKDPYSTPQHTAIANLATTPASIKPNQQVRIFFLQILARGNAASSGNSNFQSNTQQYTVVEKAIEMLHRRRYQNTQN